MMNAANRTVHKAEKREAHCPGGWEGLPGVCELPPTPGDESDEGHG